MFQTTRRRLAIWYTSVTAIVLLVFAIGMYIYVRGTLIERIDDTLNHVVEVVSRSISIDRIYTDSGDSKFQINVAASFQDDSDRLDDDRIDLELFDLSGKLLWSTLREPLNLPVWLNLDGETVRVRNDSPLERQSQRILRQITAPVNRSGVLVGFLRVSHPWFEVTKPTELLLVDLTIGTSLVIASVAAIGWLLSGIAIEPVKASYQQLKQFTADASHELRNPIATIQTNVQVALSEEPLQPLQRQQLQTIERLTRRLGRLVDDLLFLARQDSSIVTAPLCIIPLDALLMETIEEQQLAAAAKGIKLKLEILDPLPFEHDTFSINGDWDRLVRLFTNLLTNAIQYTLPQGKHPSEINIKLKHLTHQSISYLQVQIKDTGIGIPTDALPHLFDRFYRVDPARTANPSDVSSGSGLGLAIVKLIVDSHQGELSIESQVDVGTTVYVTFKSISP